MTAEIAILNKSAIALAADSTVTIGSNRLRKTFNTVNKLFTLSKYHPVGAMIYGNAEIMGVPWETIIKQFRSELGKKSFATVSDYADAFIKHLERIKPYFDDDQQRRYFKLAAIHFFKTIVADIKRDLQDAQNAGPSESLNEAQETSLGIAVRNANDVCDFVLKQEVLPCIEPDFPEKIRAAYAEEIDDAMQGTLGNYDFSAELKEKLRRGAAHFVSSVRKADFRSGVVFAGFGEEQIFPAVRTISPHLVSLGRLVFAEENGLCHEITLDSAACVMPFAQRDVVFTFVEGIKPGYRELFKSTIETVFDGLPDSILGKLGIADEEKRLAIAKAIRDNSEAAKTSFLEQIEREISENEVQPLLDVVGSLPKDELAALADALVNLTSVKRKMSHGQETVGGPIDVAVISKGDGFIWIARKHYFKPELNVHFRKIYFER